MRSIGTEDFAMFGDPDALALDQMRDADEQPSIEPTPPVRRGRKRKIVDDPVSIVLNTNYVFEFSQTVGTNNHLLH